MLVEWLYLIILIVAAFSSTILTGISWMLYSHRAARWFTWSSGITTLVIICYLLFSISEQATAAFFWVRLRLTVLSFGPVIFLGFALVFSGYLRWLRLSYMLPLLIVPSMTFVVIWFMPRHFWLDWTFNADSLISVEAPVYGGWFEVHALHSFGLGILTNIILAHFALTTPRITRQQTGTILIAILVPTMVVFLPTIGVTRNLPNPYPISLAFMYLLLFFAMFRQGFLEVPPLVYRTIVETMQDAVLVLDTQNRLVMLNEAARQLFDIPQHTRAEGQPLAAVLGDDTGLFTDHPADGSAHFEKQVSIKGVPRTLDIRVSAVTRKPDVVSHQLWVLRDITARQRIETALRRSEEQYRQLVETSHQGMTIMRVDPLQIVFASKPMETLMGYTPEETLNASAEQLTERIHPDDRERAFSSMMQWLSGSDTPLVNISYRVIHKNGTVRCMNISSTLVEYNGEPAIQSIYNDVTAQIEAEEALRKSEERLYSMLEHMQDIVWSMDPIGRRMTYINPMIEQVTGRPAAEFLKKPGLWLEITHPDDRPTENSGALANILQQGSNEWEGRIIRTDGDIRWLYIRNWLTRADDGSPLRIDGIATDITARKQMEQALRRSQAQLAEAQEIAQLGSWHWDAATQKLTWSDELYRIYGIQPGEFDGGYEDYLALLHPDERELVDQIIRSAYKKHQAYSFHHRIMHPQKGERILHASGRVVTNADGDIAYLLGTAQDVTMLKRTEEALSVRNRYLMVLHQITLELLNRRDMDDLLKAVIDHVVTILNATYGELMLQEGDELVVKAFTDNLSFIAGDRARRTQAPLSWQVIDMMQPIVISDYLSWSNRRKLYDTLQLQAVACFPIIISGACIGVLAVAHSRLDNPFDHEQIEIGMMFSQLAALIVDNVTQYNAALQEIADRKQTEAYLNVLALTLQQKNQMEHEQRVLAETLSHTAAILNSTLDLDEILKLILDNIQRIIPHDASNIMLIDDDAVAHIVQYRGLPDAWMNVLPQISFPVAQLAHLKYMVDTQKPCIIGDVSREESWVTVLPDYDYDYDPVAYMAAPIVVDDEVIGFINLDSMEPDYFTEDHSHRLQVLVNHAAVALKNARLYSQSLALATLEERQRLARDLHDSVTQTLFAASVKANATYKMWSKNNGGIGDDLLELRDLTEGALAEMRTMLLELRPNALLEANLSDLLQQLATTVKGRTRLNVQMEQHALQSAGHLPDEVQVALFRIAQEALNNIIKHARARTVTIQLHYEDERVSITIADDGRGFDLTDSTQGGLGITIMKERAARASIDLHIQSAPDSGTVLRAVWIQEV